MLPSRPDRDPRVPSIAAGIAAALLAALALACSHAEPSLDLLARELDATLEQPGVLVPEPGEEWGAAALAGWHRETLATDDGLLHVRANQPVAALSLPALASGEHELRLWAWIDHPLEGQPREVTVRLNGVTLHDPLELGEAPAPHALHAPAETWVLGENVLELEVPVVQRPGAAATWNELHLARVEYGPERRIVGDPAGAGLELPPGCGLRYLVESPTAVALRVRTRAAAPGVLELRTGVMDPATGATDFGRWPAVGLKVGRTAHEERLPLPRPGSGVLSLELLWRGTTGPVVLEGLGLVEADDAPRPPVVFVSIDTFAARHMSLYGYGRETTPALEDLARDAVVFEHCVANAPWTLPSYLSVMTGLFPAAHQVDLQAPPPGVVLHSFDRWQVAGNRWTLAEMLRARGYRTAGFIDSLWLSSKFGLGQGFDSYDLRPLGIPFNDPTGGIVRIVGAVRGWLDARQGDAPFFLFLHALDAHGPYWPEEPYRGTFSGALPENAVQVPAKGTYRTYRYVPTWMALTVVGGNDELDQVPDRMPLEPLIARYDEGILKVDAYLGRLVEILKERGLYDETLLVISADHGESFAHQHYDHGDMWQDVLAVPLLVKLPHGRFAGRRVRDAVQLVDLYPTLAELVGAAPGRPWLHGRSLVPLLRGESLDPVGAYSEGGFVRQDAVQRGRWKLIESSPGRDSGDATLLTHPRVPRAWLEEHFPELLDNALTDARFTDLAARPDFGERMRELRAMLAGPYQELYDLRTDPGETHDVAAEHPERVEALGRLLLSARERAAEAKADAHAVPSPPLTDEQRAVLSALGYGDSGR